MVPAVVLSADWSGDILLKGRFNSMQLVASGITSLAWHDFGSDLIRKDEVTEPNFWERSYDQIRDLAPRLGNRCDNAAARLTPGHVHELFQITSESVLPLPSRLRSHLKRDRVEPLVISRRVTLHQCLNVVRRRSHVYSFYTTLRGGGAFGAVVAWLAQQILDLHCDKLPSRTEATGSSSDPGFLRAFR